MKKIGIVLLVVGVFLILSALGQDDYETQAFLRNKVVETASFKLQVLTILSGVGSMCAGWSFLKEEVTNV